MLCHRERRSSVLHWRDSAPRALLKPDLSDTKERYLLSREYVGRAWLDEELERWRTFDTASKAFVLLGGPGIGKSCFSAHQLHYNPNVHCGIFCEWDKTAAKDAKSVFQTLAFKLATKLPDYRKILLEKLEAADGHTFERMTPTEYFDALLAQPLSELIDGGRERQIVFIDGLDEANAEDRNELAEVLADNMFKLPSWIAFLLTSRPEYNIRALFAPYRPTVLEPIDSRNTEDICKYVAFTLADELAVVSDRLFVLREITRRCRGSFLYASLFAEGVKAGTIDLADTEGYPNGLDAFYLQNFRRRFPDPPAYRMARPFLESLATCQDIPTELAAPATGPVWVRTCGSAYRLRLPAPGDVPDLQLRTGKDRLPRVLP